MHLTAIMVLFREFFKIIEALNKEGIDYAVVGGIALAFHSVPRFTRDIDILGAPVDLEKYEQIFRSLGYRKDDVPWTFKNTRLELHRFWKGGEADDILVVDLLLGGGPEYQQVIKNALLDDSFVGKVRLASRDDLIALKKLRNSEQDKVDINNLLNEQNREDTEGT